LGVFIDAKLNWKAHILHLTSSVAQSVGVLYKITQYLSKNLLKILYNALIKSKLSYAITLWASAYKNDLHKLNVLNNRAICCITFTNRHTNLNTLYKKHKILKLNELQQRSPNFSNAGPKLQPYLCPRARLLCALKKKKIEIHTHNMRHVCTLQFFSVFGNMFAM